MTRRARLGLLIVLSALALGSLAARRAQPSEPVRRAHASAATEAVALQLDTPRALRRTTTRAPLEHRRPVSPSHPAGDVDELAHAHPITPQHQALREQQQLVSALNDALNLRDAASLRALIERYDALSPEDPLRLAEGYERVADCIEAANPVDRTSARANAQRYYDDARASSLRRHVRRLCLEPSADEPADRE